MIRVASNSRRIVMRTSDTAHLAEDIFTRLALARKSRGIRYADALRWAMSFVVVLTIYGVAAFALRTFHF